MQFGLQKYGKIKPVIKDHSVCHPFKRPLIKESPSLQVLENGMKPHQLVGMGYPSKFYGFAINSKLAKMAITFHSRQKEI
jgi:hypothetical protein